MSELSMDDYWLDPPTSPDAFCPDPACRTAGSHEGCVPVMILEEKTAEIEVPDILICEIEIARYRRTT